MSDERINLIFDCDGTLVDSYGAIVERICRAFMMQGIKCEPEYVREWSLRTTADECIVKLAGENALNSDFMLEAVHNLAENRDLITLYPHVSDVITNKKFRCFVYTHRGTSCRIIFDRLGITDYFEEIVDRSFQFKRKPDSEGVDYLVNKYSMDKNHTFYVGDRTIDIDCGRNAGVKTIFFNSSGINVDSSDADHVINDLSEINNLTL